MTKQVEVRLTDGAREVFEAVGWDDAGGGLYVYAEGGEEVVASFAPGQWSFVSKVTLEGQTDEANTGGRGLTVGDLKLDINAANVAAFIEAYLESRSERPACPVCEEFTDSRGMCPGCVGEAS